jgi:hypothetical protein
VSINLGILRGPDFVFTTGQIQEKMAENVPGFPESEPVDQGL